MKWVTLGTLIVLAALLTLISMENFITGFPGHEKGHRAAMLAVLGQEKYDFFFDKWLEYFFTEADAAYFAQLGLNCIRLPINYRHFEDDLAPRVLRKCGFKHLDRVIDICAKAGIYTIIDLHALPGGQNVGWHSDNVTNTALFWDHKDFQDRGVWLWEQLATRYKGNAWVAGFNPINEPADPSGTALVAYYERLEKTIRAIDPDHILFLDGNTYAMDFSAFPSVLPNCVYAIHDYSTMGFPTGQPYTGSAAQQSQLRQQYSRKCEFHHRHGVPIWNGEFGPVYADAHPSHGHERSASSAVNAQRHALLGAQLALYAAEQISWSIWLYKDIGLQGMLSTSASSPWNQLIAPFLAKKRRLNLDWWGKYHSAEMERIMTPLREMVDRESETAGRQYPLTWKTERHVDRNLLHTFLSESLQGEFAELFRGKTFEELEALAGSFRFENCVQREGLNGIMAAHAKDQAA